MKMFVAQARTHTYEPFLTHGNMRHMRARIRAFAHER